MILRKNNVKQNKEMVRLKKNLLWQGILAGLALVSAVVLVFAGTVAWYTNVVQVQDLTVKAASWGFDGTVTIGKTDGLTVAPGTDGVLPVSISNNGSSDVDATVTVTKNNLIPEMKKRLFFYADVSSQAEGETVDRTWINATNGYSYSLLGNDSLSLSEELSEDALIHYYWVYDLVGYYFSGTVETNTVNGKLSATETVTDYLRPIEYDFDSSEYDENGALKTAGGIPVESFVSDLTAADGYAGSFVSNKTVITDDGIYYYLIKEATEKEPAIYLKLCSEWEIELATEQDTEYGQAALLGGNGSSDENEKNFMGNVTVNVEGIQKSRKEVSVRDFQSLLNTAASSAGDIRIKLAGNIELLSAIEVVSGLDISIDLNGYTLSYSSPVAANIYSGGKLSVMNGKIEALSADSSFVKITGGNFVSDRITLENVQYGISAENVGISDINIRVRETSVKSTKAALQLNIDKNKISASGRLIAIIDGNCNFVASAGTPISVTGSSDFVIIYIKEGSFSGDVSAYTAPGYSCSSSSGVFTVSRIQ